MEVLTATELNKNTVSRLKDMVKGKLAETGEKRAISTLNKEGLIKLYLELAAKAVPTCVVPPGATIQVVQAPAPIQVVQSAPIVAVPAPVVEKSFEKMTVAELKGEAAKRNVKKSGKREELIQNIVAYDNTNCVQAPCVDDKVCNVDTGKCVKSPEGGQGVFKLIHQNRTYYGNEDTLKNLATLFKINNAVIVPYGTKVVVKRKSPPSPKGSPKKPSRKSSSSAASSLDDEDIEAEMKAIEEEEARIAAEEARLAAERIVAQEVKAARKSASPKRPSPAENLQAEIAAELQAAEQVQPARRKSPTAPPARRKSPTAPEESPAVLAATISRVTGERPLSREQQEIVAKIRKCIGI